MPTAENNDISLNYDLSGRGDGSVLLLANSLGSNLHMWDKALPSLEKNHRVLRYDMRGHGKSSVPLAPYSIDQLGGDVLFLLDYLAIDRVNLCGISLGGLVAMWIGIHAPQRLSRLILANTAARIGTREGWDQRIALVQTLGMGPVAASTPERWFTLSYRTQNPEEMEPMRAMVASTNKAGYAGCCAALRDTDLRGEISVIEAPCLVISGSDDPTTTPSDARALQSALRDSRYVELDASHLSAWERAHEFAGAMLVFLGKGERKDG